MVDPDLIRGVQAEPKDVATPTAAAKNIVVCCDGTWNRFDCDGNTNVVKLCYCLQHHAVGQVMYYDPGVGTIATEQMRTRIGRLFTQLWDGAFGGGIWTNIREAYLFLANQYVHGDRVFLFGFSRGAYTVRAVAAILKLFGLLERGNDNLFPYIKQMLLARRAGRPDFTLYARFKSAFARMVKVHFLGVWDSVSSVGWITAPLSLPHTRSNDIIQTLRHAVSIDEQRKNFRQNLCAREGDQDFKEVWFAGSHGDVGGGYPEAESGLSKLSLEWMLGEAEKCGLLTVKKHREQVLGYGEAGFSRPDPTGPLHGPEWWWSLLQRAPRRTIDMGRDPPRAQWDWSSEFRERFMTVDQTVHQSVVTRWELVRDYRPKNLGDPHQHPIEASA